MFIVHKTGIFRMIPFHLDSVNILDPKTPETDGDKKIVQICLSVINDGDSSGYSTVIDLSCDSTKAAETVLDNIADMLVSTDSDMVMDWRSFVSSAEITDSEF